MSNIIPITSVMIDEAKWMERETLTRLEDLGKEVNWQNEYKSNRYFIGYLGELCTFSFFQRHGKRVYYPVKLNGRSQKEDLQLHLKDYDPVKIDVKTRGYKLGKAIKVKKEVADLWQPDVYVGVRLNLDDEIADVAGYVKPKDLDYMDSKHTWENPDKLLASREVPPGYFYKLFENLTDMGRLLELSESGKSTKVSAYNRSLESII